MLERWGQRLAGRGIPDACVLLARGDDAGTIRTECRTEHSILVLEGWSQGAPVVASQIRAVLSRLAVTTRVPSGLKVAACTLC